MLHRLRRRGQRQSASQRDFLHQGAISEQRVQVLAPRQLRPVSRLVVRRRRRTASDGIEGAADRLVPLEPGQERRRVLAFSPPQVGKDAPRLLGGELVPGPRLHVVEAEPVQQRLRQPAQAFVGNDAGGAKTLACPSKRKMEP